MIAIGVAAAPARQNSNVPCEIGIGDDALDFVFRLEAQQINARCPPPSRSVENAITGTPRSRAMGATAVTDGENSGPTMISAPLASSVRAPAAACPAWNLRRRSSAGCRDCPRRTAPARPLSAWRGQRAGRGRAVGERQKHAHAHGRLCPGHIGQAQEARLLARHGVGGQRHFGRGRRWRRRGRRRRLWRTRPKLLSQKAA